MSPHHSSTRAEGVSNTETGRGWGGVKLITLMGGVARDASKASKTSLRSLHRPSRWWELFKGFK